MVGDIGWVFNVAYDEEGVAALEGGEGLVDEDAGGAEEGDALADGWGVEVEDVEKGEAGAVIDEGWEVGARRNSEIFRMLGCVAVKGEIDNVGDKAVGRIGIDGDELVEGGEGETRGGWQIDVDEGGAWCWDYRVWIEYAAFVGGLGVREDALCLGEGE